MNRILDEIRGGISLIFMVLSFIFFIPMVLLFGIGISVLSKNDREVIRNALDKIIKESLTK